MKDVQEIVDKVVDVVLKYKPKRKKKKKQRRRRLKPDG
jgi:hypothetical protein